MHPEPFLPEMTGAQAEAVESRWSALREANPAYFDGRLCHVLGVHRDGHGGATIHVADCAFRFFAVQDERLDLRVRPLCVKGIVQREGLALLGRRSMNVAGYPGQWEFAPGGVVEPGDDPAHRLVRELAEETGYRAAGEPIALAVLYDDQIRTWELVYRLNVESDARSGHCGEYTDFAWCAEPTWPEPMTPIARRIAQTLLPCSA